MVHVRFDTNSIQLNDFLQSGAGFSYFEGLPPYQRGRGYFLGFSRQRGGGVGSIFESLWRMLLPMLKSAGQNVKAEGFATGEKILNNISEGQNITSGVKKEAKAGLQNLFDKASPNQQQFGTGKSIKTERIKRHMRPPLPSSVSTAPGNLVGRSVINIPSNLNNRHYIKKFKSTDNKAKRSKSNKEDTFGLY